MGEITNLTPERRADAEKAIAAIKAGKVEIAKRDWASLEKAVNELYTANVLNNGQNINYDKRVKPVEDGLNQLAISLFYKNNPNAAKSKNLSADEMRKAFFQAQDIVNVTFEKAIKTTTAISTNDINKGVTAQGSVTFDYPNFPIAIESTKKSLDGISERVRKHLNIPDALQAAPNSGIGAPKIERPTMLPAYNPANPPPPPFGKRPEGLPQVPPPPPPGERPAELPQRPQLDPFSPPKSGDAPANPKPNNPLPKRGEKGFDGVTMADPEIKAPKLPAHLKPNPKGGRDTF